MAAPVLLAVVAYLLAFIQRPGMATADTKINLHVDPGRFLSDVAAMWTQTGQLGGVQSGQQAGYLFPMGPFFALGHLVGLPDWVVQRLWLGTLLALAAWGVVALMGALLTRPAAAARLTAGAVTILNPFVVTYVNRTTVTLLAYAALPWLMLAVHRGLRRPRGWRIPAAMALLVTAAGGGVNGAVVAWMLLGPALLLVYEVLTGEASGRDARALVLRAVGLTALVSLWWVIPAWVQSSYGVNFLAFTEQPGTVWGTTSATEALRLMSFWLSYVGIGFAGRAIPYFDDSRTLLFSAPVVVATLLLPATALTGFAWTRRWRYGPFFLGLALVAVLVVMAGFPDGTPLRHGLYFTYNHVAALRFLRASYKGAPLLAIALACLAGAGAGELWARAPRLRGLATLAGLAVLVGAAWPLVSGRAQDAQVSYQRVPAAWTQAAAGLDRSLPANSRAIVLPGDQFSFYTWGGTVDPILPALSTRPVAERSEVPYSDLRATDLLWTIDGLVHQQRLVPGQLSPLLSLISARAVISGTDDDLARSDAPAPADAAAELAQLGRPAATYGPWRTDRSPTEPGAAPRLPGVRRYDVATARPIVRVEPTGDPLVVDGSAAALAQLAAFGALPAGRAIHYAADLGRTGVRAAARAGADVVISDSNRRQAFVASALDENTGPVLGAGDTVSSDGIILDPFGAGPDAETVAVDGGAVSDVQAPFSPQRVQFPEHSPSAALDGSPATAWVADPTLPPADRWLQVSFRRPERVSAVDLVPYDDAGGAVTEVALAGHSFAVHPGVNQLRFGPRTLTGLRVTITGVSAPARGAPAGAGGIRELDIPGVRVTASLRLPIDAATALRGAGLSATGLDYLFSRVTGDDPYRRNPATGQWSALRVADAGDAEQTMRRQIDVPVRRAFAARAWVTPFATTSDPTLDRLAGYRGPITVTSSGRFDGEPRWRGSAALDGSPATAWVTDATTGAPPWLQIVAPRPVTVRTLTFVPATLPVRRPTAVRLVWPGGATAALPVGVGQTVALPRTIHTRRLRIVIVASSPVPGAGPADRRALGIGELRGLGGVPAVRPRGGTRFAAPCGSAMVLAGGRRLALRIAGSTAAFAAGDPLAATSCGRPVTLAAGMATIAARPGPFAIDELMLRSPAPAPVGSPAPSGHVDSLGSGGYGDVRVSVSRPSWLVLGEGYDRGWAATCDGRSLGPPVPIDGFANGWRVAPGCTHVAISFGPQKVATIGYVLSAAGALLCLGLLLVPARRRRARGGRARAGVTPRSGVPAGSGVTARSPGPGRLGGAGRRAASGSRGRTAAWVLGAAVAFGFVFGIRDGLVALPVIAFVVWRQIGARALALAAGALLGIAAPVLYLAQPGDSAGGNHYGYATAHMSAQWVGVAALGLLMAALWRTLAEARS